VHSNTAPDPASQGPRLRIVRRDEEWREPDVHDFDAIYRRYAPYVATIGLRILGKPDEVDDLVQDVFLVAHDDLGTVKFPERVRGWLATIAVRKAMRRLRRTRLRRWLPLDEAPSSYEALADSAADPEQRAEVARVYEQLEDMSTNDRVVWVLRHVQGSTLDEISDFTGLSKSTVQRRLRKTEEQLRRKTNDD
jgi:RNA polymerase sigma-70 factor (ECF subfamily)